MKMRWILGIGILLILGGTLPASAQMMGGGGMSGMTDMMGGMHGAPWAAGCAGMAGQPVAFGSEGPWISFALMHAKELELTADQVKRLTALRDEFQKEAVRLTDEIRAAESEVRQIWSRTPVDLQTLEGKIRVIAGLEGDLRLGRVKTLEKGKALLTPEQRQKLAGIAQNMGWMRGAFMMGGPSELAQ